MALAMLTRALYDTRDLSYAERTLLMVLSDHATPDGIAWPSRERLCDVMGIGDRRLRELTHTLIQTGRLAMRRRGERVQFLLFPETPEIAERFAASGGNPAGQDGSSGGNPAEPAAGIPPTTARDQDKGTKIKSIPVADEIREDVEEVCSLVADHVESLRAGRPRPTVTRRWREDARLLLDRDRVPLEDVRLVMLWLGGPGGHRFWARNVLSVPTLRKQWDRLWGECSEGGGPAGGMDRLSQAAEQAARLEARGL